MALKKNMGTADRLVRLAVAAVIAGLYVTGKITGLVALVLCILAVVFVLTSIVSFCPLYAPLGINTCKR